MKPLIQYIFALLLIPVSLQIQAQTLIDGSFEQLGQSLGNGGSLPAYPQFAASWSANTTDGEVFASTQAVGGNYFIDLLNNANTSYPAIWNEEIHNQWGWDRAVTTISDLEPESAYAVIFHHGALLNRFGYLADRTRVQVQSVQSDAIQAHYYDTPSGGIWKADTAIFFTDDVTTEMYLMFCPYGVFHTSVSIDEVSVIPIDICPGGDLAADEDNDQIPDKCDICPHGNDLDDIDFDGIPDACDLVRVELHAFLEGALIPDSAVMKNNLQLSGLIPSEHPFQDYENPEVQGADYGGDFDDAVDWVMVEARMGNNQTGVLEVLERQAGILLTDGRIVDPVSKGTLGFRNVQDNHSYFFTVRHRNHLDICTPQILFVWNEFAFYDFRQNPAFGIEQQKVFSLPNETIRALHAGDYNGDQVVQLTDFDVWKVDPSILNTYFLSDGNLDGTVQTSDYDTWFSNKAKIGSPFFD